MYGHLRCRFGHILPSYQTIQLGAALGLTRFAIMLGLLNHPLFTVAGMAEDTVKRQVRNISTHNYKLPGSVAQ